jgi:hypothetical protein
MMKRIILMVTVAAMMAAMVVVAMVPAFAQVDREDLVRDLTITSTTIDPQTKVVTVEGTVRCSQVTNFAFVGAEVSQVVGRLHTVRGFDFERFRPCEGRTFFTLRIAADEGRFGPGEATVRVFADACSRELQQCDSDRLSEQVRLTTTH